MTQSHPEPFTDPVLAEIAARWVAARRDPASALRAAREGLTLFGLLGGFHTDLARFEAAVRADALASVTAERDTPAVAEALSRMTELCEAKSASIRALNAECKSLRADRRDARARAARRRDQVLTEAAELIQAHRAAVYADAGRHTADGMDRARDLLLVARTSKEG